jgi:hypothetical protein
VYQLLTLGVAEDIADQVVDVPHGGGRQLAHHRKRELVEPDLVDGRTEVVVRPEIEHGLISYSA